MKRLLYLSLLTLLLPAFLCARGNRDVSPPAQLKDAAANRIVAVDAESYATQNLNLYVAYEKGFFKKRNLDVEIRQSGSGISQVANGEADIVFSCPSGVITGIDRGYNIAAIAQVQYPCTSTLIVPADSPVKKPEELKNRLITGYSNVCCAVISIRDVLRSRYSTDFILAALEPDSAVIALGGKQSDGAILEEPFLSLVLLKKDGTGSPLYRAIFDGRSDADSDGVIEPSLAGSPTCHLISANRSFIALWPEKAWAFIEAIDEANRTILENPVAPDIVDIAKKYISIERELVIASNPRMFFSVRLAVDAIVAYADQLLRQGAIDKNPGERIFAPEFKGITW
jgi:NitT/TauT family transport system substrate-binding protein